MIVDCPCRPKLCKCQARLLRQVFTREWKLMKVVSNSDECSGDFGGSSRSGIRHFPSVYISEQVSRMEIQDMNEIPATGAWGIVSTDCSKDISRCQPSLRHFCAFHYELLQRVARKREIQMATMEEYVKLLLGIGHDVELSIVTRAEIKAILKETSSLHY